MCAAQVNWIVFYGTALAAISISYQHWNSCQHTWTGVNTVGINFCTFGHSKVVLWFVLCCSLNNLFCWLLVPEGISRQTNLCGQIVRIKYMMIQMIVLMVCIISFFIVYIFNKIPFEMDVAPWHQKWDCVHISRCYKLLKLSYENWMVSIQCVSSSGAEKAPSRRLHAAQNKRNHLSNVNPVTLLLDNGIIQKQIINGTDIWRE